MTRPHKHWSEAVADYRNRGEAFVLVTVLDVAGSAPRENGTKMVVGIDGQAGTIGGGHLEHSVTMKAHELLQTPGDHQRIERYPLGPKLGQCCGGQVTILLECFNQTQPVVVLFGAGHVGKALVTILAQLPVSVTWVDSREALFPNDIPADVNKVISRQPEDEVIESPADAYYVVMTHLHPLDYAITEAVLKRRDAQYLGVIGSETKSRRFKMRLRHRGFSEADIAFMQCPLGMKDIPGKHPMEVAVSVSGQLIAQLHAQGSQRTRIVRTDIKLLDNIQQEDIHD